MPDTHEVLQRLLANRSALDKLLQAIADDEQWLAKQRGDKGERTIEEHLLVIAPQEGFDITDIADTDRRQIAKVILDAYLLGTSWLTRDDAGFKREDPLRIEVRDRRMT